MLVKDTTRKLARVVTIDKISPIAKADRLELATVGGWECVVQKGLFKAGDKAIYFEIDSAIAMDHPILSNFDKSYLKVTVDEHTQKEYAVIKTVKLRGARSQGLLLDQKHYANSDKIHLRTITKLPDDSDVTLLLDVLKYVSKEEAKLYSVEENNNRNQTPFRKFWNNLRLKIVGNIVTDSLLPFPAGQTKSSEERIQNANSILREIQEEAAGVELSYKLNGESATFYTDLNTGKVGVAQRNFALRIEDVIYTFTQSLRVYVSDWMRFVVRRLAGAKCSPPLWRNRYHAQSVPLVAYFVRSGIAKKIEDFNNTHYNTAEVASYLTIQGEMVGPDFHGNMENCPNNRFYMYRAYRNGSYALTPIEARNIANLLGVDYIPVVHESSQLEGPVKDILKMADGAGYFDPSIPREGLVAKCNATGKSVKIISNKWLEWLDAKEAQEKIS